MLRMELWKHGPTNLRGVPTGLMSRILRELRPDGTMLYLCCGSRPVPGAVNVDIDPKSKCDIVADATRAPFNDSSFPFVFCDPPYPKYDSWRFYHTQVIPLYTLMEEMSRLTSHGGVYAILYPFRPQTLTGDKLEAHIVTPGGVHYRPRILSVFRRGQFKAIRAIQYRAKVNKEEVDSDNRD